MRAWWQRRTLRFRLGLWYAVVGTLLLASFSATLYTFVEKRMAVPLDHQLRQDLRLIEGQLAITADGRVLWNGEAVVPGSPWTTRYPWFELWDEEGNLVRRLWPFSENRVQLATTAPMRGRETFSVFSVAPDLRLRVLSLPFPVPGREEPWMIRVMRLHEHAGGALGALRAIILIALPVVVLLLCAGGYWLTRRWLAPLDRMAAEANRITPDDLSRRLSEVNTEDELGRLGRVFNITLERLEDAFVTLDRFVADASHELRTPLTTLRNVGEVGLRRSRTPEEYREIIGSMLEEAQRLEMLIQRLLELATVDGGGGEVRQVDVVLERDIPAWVGELAILAEQKGQSVVTEVVPGRVRTDPILLRRALQNLLENAIKYSPAETAIRVQVDDEPGRIVLSVRDEGPGIRPEHRSEIAQRFFRPDRGRGRTSGGFGLGLAITKAYMRKLGGALRFQPNEPRGSVFSLVLPVSRMPGDSPRLDGGSSPERLRVS